ncbi:MAG: sodium:solute symporter [Candidatus Nezhaarchaeota archaeon]|nr:sodium:solute symporter [Candidatus Nezhaarchaeota archaeon]
MPQYALNVDALIVFILYLIAIAIIGYFGAKRTKTVADFVAASGQLGFWTYVLLMVGSVLSGMSLIGVAGLGFTSGWSNVWERVIGPAFAISFCTVLVGYKLWPLRKKYNLLTIQDYFAIRYEDPKAMRAIAGIISAITCFAYLLGQFAAIGVVSEVILGVPYFIGSLIALLVVVGYVMTGGMFSTAWTTFLQAILMIAGVYITVPIIIQWVGGWTALNELASQVPTLQQTYRGQPPTYLFGPFLDKPGSLDPRLTLVGWTFNFTLFGITVPLGLLVAPHIVNNVLCYKDVKYTKWAPIATYVLAMILILFTSIAGLAARVAWAQGRLDLKALTLAGGVTVAWSDMAYPTIAKLALPYALFIFLLPCVLAAVMSTTDRLLVTAASNISYDVVKNVFKPDISEKALTWISRGLVAAFGIIAWALTITPQPMLAWFIWAALSVIISTFLWPVLGGLYWRRMNKHAARWGMIVGLVTSLVFVYLAYEYWGRVVRVVVDTTTLFVMFPSIPGLIASTIVTLILAYVTKPQSEQVLKETLTGPFLRARS